MIVKSVWQQIKKDIWFIAGLFTMVIMIFFVKDYFSQKWSDEEYNKNLIRVIGDKSTYDELKKVKNIRDIKRGMIITYRMDWLFTESDIPLKDNEAIISDKILKESSRELKVGDTFTFNYLDVQYNYIIKDIGDGTKCDVCLNENNINKLMIHSDKVYYYMTVKNIYDYKQTIYAINKATHYKYIANQIRINYFNENRVVLISFLNILGNLGGLILLFVLIYFECNKSFHNLALYNKLYFAYGYTEKELRIINILKIVVLFTSAIIISIILANVLAFIFL